MESSSLLDFPPEILRRIIWHIPASLGKSPTFPQIAEALLPVAASCRQLCAIVSSLFEAFGMSYSRICGMAKLSEVALRDGSYDLLVAATNRAQTLFGSTPKKGQILSAISTAHTPFCRCISAWIVLGNNFDSICLGSVESSDVSILCIMNMISTLQIPIKEVTLESFHECPVEETAKKLAEMFCAVSGTCMSMFSPTEDEIINKTFSDHRVCLAELRELRLTTGGPIKDDDYDVLGSIFSSLNASSTRLKQITLDNTSGVGKKTDKKVELPRSVHLFRLAHNSDFINSIVQCSELRAIEFSCLYVHMDDVAVLNSLPKLKKISFKKCKIGYPERDESGFRCPVGVKVHRIFNSKYNDLNLGGLEFLTANCANLEVLSALMDPFNSLEMSCALGELMKACPRLRVLNMYVNDFGPSPEALSASKEVITRMMQCKCRFEHLVLRELWVNADEFLGILQKFSDTLKVLQVHLYSEECLKSSSRFFAPTDEVLWALEMVLQHCQGLQRLSFGWSNRDESLLRCRANHPMPEGAARQLSLALEKLENQNEHFDRLGFSGEMYSWYYTCSEDLLDDIEE